MTSKGNILVGTVGQGVMMSADDGESWTRASVRQGMHSDSIVRMLRSDSRNPEVVYAGTDLGLYRSDDAGAKWRLLENPMKGSVVWSMAIDPVDPAVMFAGTGTPSRPGIFRSTDGDKSWTQFNVAIADDCPNVGVPRPTGIAVDPTNDRNVWVGLEVDGVRHSTDGGETWTKVNGQIWHAARAREVFPWHYPRGIAVRPDDPRTVFLTLGDSTPGRIGTVVRSRDAGVTWETLKFPVHPNSAIWTVAVSESAPDIMFAASRYGYLYRSDDGGDSWRKLWREFGEVSSIQWVPR